ncbi:hypothetical protein LPZ50_15490, partial [Bordetella petrii]|nr:hypothetical protein [Bordetella petrii]
AANGKQAKALVVTSSDRAAWASAADTAAKAAQLKSDGTTFVTFADPATPTVPVSASLFNGDIVIGATIQPGAATVRLRGEPLAVRQITDRHVRRSNLLASVSDDELSPAALAARVLLAQTVESLVRAGAWPGATLHKS